METVVGADRARSWRNPFAWPVAPSDEDERAFWAHRHQEGTHAWGMALLLGFCVTVAWWPTDPFVFGRIPGAAAVFARVRAFLALSAIGMFLLVRFVPAFRARPYQAMSAVAVGAALVSAAELGRLGGPDRIWFHFTHLLVLSPVAVSLRPAHRAALTATIAATLAVGFFGAHPEHLADPLAAATLSWLVFLAVLSAAAGMFADTLRRNEFFQRRAAVRLTEELSALKASLEARVAARTLDVRRLAAHLESAREAERTRVARELHDELGQELTALRYAVELCRRRWTGDPVAIGPNLDVVDGLLARTRQTARSIPSDLRPRVLDDLGFGAASEWLVTRTRERTGVEVALRMPDPEPALGREVATAAFRVLQEALANAARHADAARVDVTVSHTDEVLEVVVTDDGVGFDPAAPAGPGGFGLLGMRERAEALGGQLEVQSVTGGTTVRVRLPAPPPAPGEAEASS